ncbi:TraB/GumN family protein [Alkalisalibacterium limincola]|uniref:TraB/GumN family protein n=1 Tax=Alkalisalibacterium limincola TaxID=2699169 RepID=UPI00164FB196|nr:TraB/GumN family protein [Alkalisalibacterium limincola]
MLPPDTYARWIEQKGRYLGRDRKVERWRPIFAAQKLHEAAVEANAMARLSPVSTLVKDTAQARGLPRVESTLKITIDDPRDAMREFKATEVEDLACFEATLQRLESDIGLLRGRANAWATGDLDILRELSGADPGSACIQALLGTGMLARRGFDDLEARVHASWLAAAEQALVEYPVTVGAIPMSEALRPGGLLAQLAARGYTVRAPDEFEDDEYDDAGAGVEVSTAATAEHPAD